jgi:hypothetical protein
MEGHAEPCSVITVATITVLVATSLCFKPGVTADANVSSRRLERARVSSPFRGTWMPPGHAQNHKLSDFVASPSTSSAAADHTPPFRLGHKSECPSPNWPAACGLLTRLGSRAKARICSPIHAAWPLGLLQARKTHQRPRLSQRAVIQHSDRGGVDHGRSINRRNSAASIEPSCTSRSAIRITLAS